jgi:hypothetical protein
LDKIIYFDYRGFDPTEDKPEKYFLDIDEENVDKKNVEIEGKIVNNVKKDTKVTDFNLLPSDTERAAKTDVENILQLKDNDNLSKTNSQNEVEDKTVAVNKLDKANNVDNMEIVDNVDSANNADKHINTVENGNTQNIVVTDKKNVDEAPAKVLTIQDYEELTPLQGLTFDRRTAFQYLKDLMIIEHPVASIIFKRSFIDPPFLQILKETFKLSLQFGINAMLYTDGYIDQSQSQQSDGETVNNSILYRIILFTV